MEMNVFLEVKNLQKLRCMLTHKRGHLNPFEWHPVTTTAALIQLGHVAESLGSQQRCQINNETALKCTSVPYLKRSA